MHSINILNIGSGFLARKEYTLNWVKALFSFVLLLTITVIAFSASALAQNSVDPANSQSLDLKVSSLEQSYDAQVYLLLSNYFDRKKFFVNTGINAEFVDETVETTSNAVVRNQPDPIIMPGLPFLPQENLRQPTGIGESPETVINQNTVRTLRLIDVNISIYADTSFNAEEIQFMRLLTGISAKINESRGDVITIAQIPIPKFGDDDPVRIVQTEPEDFNLVASFRQYIPGFVLLFLFGLIMMFSHYFNNKANNNRVSPLQQRESIKHDINISDYNPRAVEQVMVNGSSQTDPSIEVDELIESFFTKSQEISLLFEFWMSDSPEEGTTKAAEVVASVDQSLLRAIKNDMQSENYEAIISALDELPPMTSEYKNSVIRNFNSVLRSGNKNSLNSKKNGHITLFKFLDHINERQMVNLLEDEGYQTGALILDYLPEDKAARILDRLDKTKSTNIMLKMTTINSIPYKLQSEISARLFEKAMDLIDEEREQRLGAENILPVLDKLPLSEQQNYIDQLKATNSVVGEIVQRQFITVDQVISLTDDIIKDALKDINTTTLLDAIIGLDQKLIDKILSVRPRREQRLIRLELSEMGGNTSKDTTYAKAKMMESIRNTVKESKKDQ